ncbi:hypothetical protein [Yersinia pseudotuberculosis]|uniref:hypothetical protein n=1 Tax=Yersinia pseudotuberculosis TaxID=633 RepID=UPI00061CC802|nr:hypothetical protein [Yersinia pseudotuberculosis]EKI5684838.1 hypothetical protein [Salmonella enterica]AXY35081.1 hypothetical protein CEQ20_18025 [Yersinia pseudotuberculosis]AYX10743.1 hypothetical protein EGX52_08075 [Yersinia pseudotuberculosis]MBO1566339.1 hypothetical protein [Yersinia pseudotuberculosis]MBO1589537.1 hypothetical protein [Yersinia pseudotuberculosis]
MSIEQEYLRGVVFKNYYIPAVESIGKVGRYWFSETRQAASMLSALLEEAGMRVILCNFPPRWEFVICLIEDYDRDFLLDIAYRRHELLEQDVDERELPV